MGQLLYVIVMLAVMVRTNGYPSGAPRSSCSTLVPRHGAARSQTQPSPYTVQFDNPPGGYESVREIRGKLRCVHLIISWLC